MRKPKLNAIRMFEAAARHLNFRLAAEELNLTQGAVAQTIRGMERDLGIKLFKRLARGLELTAPAKAYYSDITRGLAIIDQATSALQPSVDLVSISVPPSFASKWLVPRLPRFAEAHPAIEVRIIASETRADLFTRDVDIAVRQGQRPIDPGLIVHHLAAQDLCALCSPTAPFVTKPVTCLSALADMPLIQDGHRHWESLLSELDTSPRGQRLQFNQTALALDAAANGQGIAIAPRLIGENDLAMKRLITLWQDTSPSDLGFWLVHPKFGKANDEARAALAEWIVKESTDRDL